MYRRVGKEALSEQIFERLDRQRLDNPYYHYMLAQRAMNEGELEESIIKFKLSVLANAQAGH